MKSEHLEALIKYIFLSALSRRLSGCIRLTDATPEAISMHMVGGTLKVLDLTSIEKVTSLPQATSLHTTAHS